MRQAGRYLPAYRALRQQYSLRTLFFTPSLAAQITKMPVDILGVDAAILFSDITVVALPLGFTLDFAEGPVISGTLQRKSIDTLTPIATTIKLLKKELKVPLIGFCGGPYTVASYMGGDPTLLPHITDVSIEYLQMQEKAGVDAIQIFDSWAHLLSFEDFKTYCNTYIKKLIAAVNVPVIFFMRKASSFVDTIATLKLNAISFDWEKPLHELRTQVPMAMQGNLNPDILYEPHSNIEKKTRHLLDSMKNDPGFIVNLGHGVKPDMSVDAVRCFVDTVKTYG
jgi:uroporphyrinogen decarboxylase